MTLFLLIFLSIVVALVTLVLLSLGLNTAGSQIANNDWAKALGWVVSAAIVALALVAVADRMPL